MLFQRGEDIMGLPGEEDDIKMEKILSKILEIGEAMLIAGGEVSRVEDTISRLCSAYGMCEIHVFSITNSIVVTVTTADERVITQTRRIHTNNTDFTRLELLNELSRELCGNPRDETYIQQKLDEIYRTPGYPKWICVFAYALISASFTVFFGGSFRDAAASAPIGVMLYFLVRFNRSIGMNYIVSNLVCSFLGGAAAVILVRFGPGQNIDKIVIGNIMPLIPGLAFTNAIRDMINGDVMAGTGRLCESVLTAIALAVGFTVTLLAY